MIEDSFSQHLLVFIQVQSLMVHDSILVKQYPTREGIGNFHKYACLICHLIHTSSASLFYAHMRDNHYEDIKVIFSLLLAFSTNRKAVLDE